MSATNGSVTRELRKKGEYALAEMLEDMDPEQRVEKFKKAFLMAVKNFDDDRAEKYLECIFILISDIHQNNENEIITNKAKVAIELYKTLPLHGTGEGREQYSQNESISVSVDTPVFKKTRQVLINEIAWSWKITKDENEADRLFDELISLPSEYESEIKDRLQIIRKITDGSFPLERLIRLAYIASLNYKECVDSTMHRNKKLLCKDVCEILTIAWIKNKVDSRNGLEFVGIDKQLEILSKIENSSAEALSSIIKEIDKIVTFDKRVQVLKLSIKKEEDLFRNYQQDKLDIQFIDSEYIKILLDHTGTSSQSAWQAANNFDLLCNVVRKWKKINSKTKVDITYSCRIFSAPNKKGSLNTEVFEVTL
ncbi:hypothetical protein A2V49_01250 [candidate division WWE3 bacterium RBG_19FT_COMBO_34_6]|uniref:Uncharacterized protein n=1 Tax=candidate division WWE3 bacterium RBG_19FT_COMBO_34_6 TaxID=1802612 RepID=A0A1F4UJX5_UNCKA|nr:MAG: hypothetical protein A2V49_01250 [candidate division WWE3 bacterium RBG_19FT_COMBO_34_6]